MRLLVGGYTSEGNDGLAVVELDDSGFGRPQVVAKAENPSYAVVSADGGFVYAVLERSEGAVGAWAVGDGDRWRGLGEQPTGGADPCHLALTDDGAWLVAANYTSGSVAAFPVEDDRSLGPRTALVTNAGSPGPDAGRQDGPHAHEVDVVEEGLLVCDLGLDAVIGYELRDGRLTEVVRSALPPGSGPRHLAHGDDTVYVVSELASTVTVCRRDGLSVTPLSTVSSRAGGRDGENLAAEILVDRSTGRVLVSNRGDDTVVVFRPAGDRLEVVQVLRSGGHWPRWMGFPEEDTLLVANERSGDVSRFGRADDGWSPVDTLQWPKPTCVVRLG